MPPKHNNVAKVLRKALKKDCAKEKIALEEAYEDAEKDQARKKVIKEWNTQDTLDSVEDWKW
jgi:hypothetical protein